METIKLRPHHLLDVVTDFQRDEDPDYVRAPGQNNVRTFVRMLPEELDTRAEFVIGPDFICEPCGHLQPDGSCDRILEQHRPPEPIDTYNDRLDRRILDYLGMAPGTIMTLREFLEMVNGRAPGIEEACTHPTQQKAARLDELIKGLVELGVRSGGK